MSKNDTSQFVQVSDVRGILAFLKNGSLCSLIEVESVNCELKSNDEQVAIIRGFQDFLNAIDFPIQIAISSRKLNIAPYLSSLETVTQGLTNELLRVQATEYTRFVKGLTELANIMDKRFFVIVPYHAVEAVASSGSIKQRLGGAFSAAHKTHKFSDEQIAQYQTQMEQRLSLIIASLAPLGLKLRVLGEEELMNLYVEYYK